MFDLIFDFDFAINFFEMFGVICGALLFEDGCFRHYTFVMIKICICLAMIIRWIFVWRLSVCRNLIKMLRRLMKSMRLGIRVWLLAIVVGYSLIKYRLFAEGI